MHNTKTSLAMILIVCVALLQEWSCTKADTSHKEMNGKALFVHEIQPVLIRKCLSCHGNEADDIRGNFDMRARATMLRGGDSGKSAVIPGQPDQSPLIAAIRREDPESAMPPKTSERLEAEEIELFEEWIALGAPWPDEAETQAILEADDWQYGDRIKVATSGGQSDNWNNRRYKLSNLWAFLPLQEPAIPNHSSDGPSNHPVDAFINRKLKSEGLKAAPKADKRTLIRRATFDLTGLPPTQQEIDAFLQDDSEKAFEKVTDRLLASPHYGEQWGRHWLDVVRYADSDGYANDFIRPNAWRYRDYVIRSFNEDKPYHQFIKEQLAGDEINPNDPELLIATGFLRMGPWEHTHMSIAAETRQLFLDDVTNIVGEALLSIPLNCAKCHDHKYDPIPTKDYYRMQAVFVPTQPALRKAAFLPEENLSLAPQEKQRIEEWIKETRSEQKIVHDKEEDAARDWYRKKGKPYLPKKIRRKLPKDEQPPRYYGLTYQDLGYRKVLNKRLQTLRKTMARFDPLAFSVYNGPNRVVYSYSYITMPEVVDTVPPPTYVLDGGSVYAPQEEVTPGVISAVTALTGPMDTKNYDVAKSPIPQSIAGRRLALAEWLTQPNHPLTSRSMVNRIWQYHFGKGIAENANNFGATGKKPSHPELLDWLAAYFIRHNWSVKSLHRLIMSSEAYQRSSTHPNKPSIEDIDPDNQWLMYSNPRRLSAEEIRDAMLSVSGELNLEMGGLPVRPEINQEVAMQPRHIMGSIAQAYQPYPTPAQRNRRTIYAERYRNLSNPMLEVFNRPSSEVSCERRNSSTITPQALSLFNSSQVRDRGIALAKLIVEEFPANLRQQTSRAIQSIWNRQPTEKELSEALAYVEEMITYHQENRPVNISYPTQIKRKMFEEMTGEPFEYVEQLDIYKNYEPDTKDIDVSPQTRGLADLAVVLFNSNEFIYVY